MLTLAMVLTLSHCQDLDRGVAHGHHDDAIAAVVGHLDDRRSLSDYDIVPSVHKVFVLNLA